MASKAQLGDAVTYRLTADDVERINGRRRDQANRRAARYAAKVSADDARAGVVQGPDLPDHGTMGHVGNPATAGQPCAALVVAVAGAKVNLQVFLDGNDTQWVTGVAAGSGSGQWSARAA